MNSFPQAHPQIQYFQQVLVSDCERHLDQTDTHSHTEKYHPTIQLRERNGIFTLECVEEFVIGWEDPCIIGLIDRDTNNKLGIRLEMQLQGGYQEQSPALCFSGSSRYLGTPPKHMDKHTGLLVKGASVLHVDTPAHKHSFWVPLPQLMNVLNN